MASAQCEAIPDCLEHPWREQHPDVAEIGEVDEVVSAGEHPGNNDVVGAGDNGSEAHAGGLIATGMQAADDGRIGAHLAADAGVDPVGVVGAAMGGAEGDAAVVVARIPILINVPAFTIVALITWLLLRGVKESARANNIMVVVKLLALTLFIVAGLTKINTANYHPFAPNGFAGIHHGAAIVFFAYIGFDAISTAAEETKNPQRNLPIGILGGLAICTLIYVIVGAVLTGMVPYRELDPSLHADPLAYALQRTGMQGAGWLVAFGAVFSMTAVLLVFQYGQPRIFYSMARDGLLPKWAAKVSPIRRVPYITTILTGVFVAVWSLIGDAGETYDLTNIGTLFAFALVCIGVLVLRYTQPERPRPFRVPFVWPVCVGGAAACVFVMWGLPAQAWERFGWWLVIGLLIYVVYGYRNSVLRKTNRDAAQSTSPTS